MLDYFSTFRIVQRQQRKLLLALAQWQRSPQRDLGEFGLSITTEISNPSSAAITVQFSLHHEAGGILQSGLISFSWDGADLDWLSDSVATLVLEFLLPSVITHGLPSIERKPLTLLEGGLPA
jgi:hypothetical protein